MLEITEAKDRPSAIKVGHPMVTEINHQLAVVKCHSLAIVKDHQSVVMKVDLFAIEEHSLAITATL